MITNFINWIGQIFGQDKNDRNLIGLTGLKDVETPVFQEIQKPVNTKNIKLSDLMKGADY